MARGLGRQYPHVYNEGNRTEQCLRRCFFERMNVHSKVGKINKSKTQNEAATRVLT